MGNVSKNAIRIVEEIKRRTACEHYRIVLNEERNPEITDSKIGGVPYWPLGEEFPLDDQNHEMLCIMQVNCSEAGLKAPLPDHGMLQWFISVDPDRMYGCQGNYEQEGKYFRVVYHEEVDHCVTPLQAPAHNEMEDRLTPVRREVAIDIVPEQTMMGVNDGRFNRLLFDIVKEITGEEISDKMWYEYMGNDDCLYLEQELGMKRPRHQMLGYPVFSQEDARRNIEQHDTLLFQLDSQFSAKDRKELVMWGDMGSGFVFINHDDLAARDFSHAYYCWDCG